MRVIQGGKGGGTYQDADAKTVFMNRSGPDYFLLDDIKPDVVTRFDPREDVIAVRHSALFPEFDKPDTWGVYEGGRGSAVDVGFIYSPDAGKVWFDPDGAGGEKATLIACLPKYLDLTDDNLVVA